MKQEPPTFTIHQTKGIHSGKIFKVHQETVTLPNGRTANVDIVKHPGAAAVVPFLDTFTIILLRQYRHALREFIWEIPAGTLSQEEDPLECARRELREETGYESSRMNKLSEITPVPGYSDERVHLFVAEDLRKTAQHLDDDEILVTEEVPFDTALDMIRGGEIRDAKTIVGLLMVRDHLANK
jgi:ADP-ribose pyrophosphatase